MSSYYECHITMEGNPEKIRPVVESRKWKFSCIDGDINLGDGIKCYATKQFNKKFDAKTIQSKLFDMAIVIEHFDIRVLRRKVEVVIFDDRSSKVRCTGGCIECHLDDLCSM